jgi:adenylate cyclase
MSRGLVRRLRLGAAFILLAYLVLHFTNHALGLVSLETMELGRWWFLALWRSAPGAIALYGAIAVHGILALWVLYDRRTLRMPPWELAQYTLGLLLPALLAAHVVGTRIAWWRFGVEDSYSRIVFVLWLQSPEAGARQAVTLVLAWVHAGIGLHYWLRFRPWYPRAAPWLFAVALLLPTLALLGFVSAGREVAARARTPGWSEAMLRAANAPDPVEAAQLDAIRRGFLDAYLYALVGVFAARGVRRLLEWRRSVRVTYPNGRVVTAPRGFSILDASRFAGIPHASVCGGRGRCSTCRVRIAAGLHELPVPSDAERRVLARVGAAPDVRLACQTRPSRDVAVEPLLAPSVAPVEAFATDVRQGREQELAVLFADLRGFTRLAENKLPYDVVFVLNRYFEAVGTAITGAGGVTNQFTGDGVMALFGIESGPATGSRQALAAARAMIEGVNTLSAELATHLGSPLRIGIGIHTGPAVVGRMGWGESFYLTAVGDTVHVAARLEQATKDYSAQLVVSEAVARHATLDLSNFPAHDLTVRNRAEPVPIRVITHVANLPTTESAPDRTSRPA